MGNKLKILVVDDSAYARKVIKDMLSAADGIEVVGSARDGLEALELVEKLRPDVVVLDLIMPRMDGVKFLKKQMKLRPIPVLVVSVADETEDLALQALEAGALDFIQKPTALATEKIYEIRDELIHKLRTVSKASMTRFRYLYHRTKNEVDIFPKLLGVHKATNFDAVVIGISTGGPHALRVMIPQFPPRFPVPMAIVLHMPVGYTQLYAKKLNEVSQIRVEEAREGQVLAPASALLAPAGRHLILRRLTKDTVVAHLDVRPFNTLHRPSVDVLFRSAAKTYEERLLAVVMTGMGSDGKEGAAWVKAKGGKVLTEAEESCVVYGMPRAVVEAGLSDRTVPLERMAQVIMEEVSGS